MKQSVDVDIFIKTLTDKGYTGYFFTEAAHPGKLKESVYEYLEICNKGLGVLKDVLLLTGYLYWEGNNKHNVQCNLWVKHDKGMFDLQKMEITKISPYGKVMKHIQLTGLSVHTAPAATDAVAMVSEPKKIFPKLKRMR